jgi:putative toxin-antitoxin system antitoxin component (TIGR02293 family)
MTDLSKRVAPNKTSARRHALKLATAASVAMKSGRAAQASVWWEGMKQDKGEVPTKSGRTARASVLDGKQEARPSKTLKKAAVQRVKVTMAPGKLGLIAYVHTEGVDAFISRIAKASPMEIVEVERRGIDSIFLKDLSKCMDVPAVRIFDIVGIPKATAEKKVAAQELIAGAGGQAALGLARLLAIAKGIVENSKAAQAKNFDAAKWLGRWIERPQPALGGRKPADLIGTPTGLDMVTRVLGAIESGAYQ